jgi:uncharacterized protein YgiM (DUF1202 family)
MARKGDSSSWEVQRAVPWLALALLLVWMGVGWFQLTSEQGPVEEASGQAVPEAPKSDEPPAKKAKVLAPLLNFRAGPADNAVVLSTLKQDELVEVIEQQEDWLLVRSEDGKSGYIVNKPDFIELLAE